MSDDLQRRIAGALKSTIDAHGPITRQQVGSAAKRIAGAIAKPGGFDTVTTFRTEDVDAAARVAQGPMARYLVGVRSNDRSDRTYHTYARSREEASQLVLEQAGRVMRDPYVYFAETS